MKNYLIRIKLIKYIFEKKNYLNIKYNYINKLKRDFKKALGYEPNLKNPSTFNEKIQWLKLYYREPILTYYADKHKVRDIIKEKIGNKYLIEQYGVYEDPYEIKLDNLPNQFVLKPNHGAGRVIICVDKNKMDWELERRKMQKWLKENYYYINGEWQYKNIKPMLICEKMLQANIVDYKIFCFNGSPKFIQVIGNRSGGGYYSNYYDLEWSLMDIDRSDHGIHTETIPKPKKLTEMLNISEKLSREFPFVRVDLYLVDGNVYFGETTFTPANGLINFQPNKYDIIFGEYLKLPSKTL